METKENVKQNAIQDEPDELNTGDLTGIEGGIDDDDRDVPIGGPCGLGCFQGSGGVDEPAG